VVPAIAVPMFWRTPFFARYGETTNRKKLTHGSGLSLHDNVVREDTGSFKVNFLSCEQWVDAFAVDDNLSQIFGDSGI
jgi:hypothetical protein